MIVSALLYEEPETRLEHEASARLEEATQLAERTLMARGEEECLRALGEAIASLREGPATAEGIEQLGQGWVAEEALAIAVYSAAGAVQEGLESPEATFEHGVRLAVNHSGDSDSTGAICGYLLGALLG